jgi:hypothetical protein
MHHLCPISSAEIDQRPLLAENTFFVTFCEQFCFVNWLRARGAGVRILYTVTKAHPTLLRRRFPRFRSGSAILSIVALHCCPLSLTWSDSIKTLALSRTTCPTGSL